MLGAVMGLIYPMVAMVLLTVLVALRLLYFNTMAVLTGVVHIKHFRLFDENLPQEFQAMRQHYKNMFELPLLFYVLCIAGMGVNSATIMDLMFAWGFVGFRFLHSLVRIPNRNVNIRFGCFLASFIMLLGGWISFILKWI